MGIEPRVALGETQGSGFSGAKRRRITYETWVERNRNVCVQSRGKGEEGRPSNDLWVMGNVTGRSLRGEEREALGCRIGMLKVDKGRVRGSVNVFGIEGAEPVVEVLHVGFFSGGSSLQRMPRGRRWVFVIDYLGFGVQARNYIGIGSWIKRPCGQMWDVWWLSASNRLTGDQVSSW